MEIKDIISSLQPALPAHSFEALRQQLSDRVAYLIDHDFEKLVRLLYTIDVDERDLKHLLQQQRDRPAADIIAERIIKRQLQKALLRQQTKTNTPRTDEESW